MPEQHTNKDECGAAGCKAPVYTKGKCIHCEHGFCIDHYITHGSVMPFRVGEGPEMYLCDDCMINKPNSSKELYDLINALLHVSAIVLEIRDTQSVMNRKAHMANQRASDTLSAYLKHKKQTQNNNDNA